jgi:uracil-DNA glycosylase
LVEPRPSREFGVTVVDLQWAEVAAAISTCTRCPELAATRTQVVPGVRPNGARLMLVGEAPGATEDATGVPFAGRAGQLLDSVLAEAGLDRAATAVVNVLKCRPPGNRKPARAEVAHCRPWLEQQWTLAEPELVVTLGGTAAEWALGSGVRLGASRGVVHEVVGRRLVVTYHPSAALRFGPKGAPMAALREDLAWAARLLDDPAATGPRVGA